MLRLSNDKRLFEYPKYQYHVVYATMAAPSTSQLLYHIILLPLFYVYGSYLNIFCGYIMWSRPIMNMVIVPRYEIEDKIFCYHSLWR